MASESSPLLEEPSRPEPEAISPPNVKSTNISSRISSLDLTRGLICMLMAIDHTFFVSAKEHPTESWSVHPDRHHLYLSSWYHYGLRFVTHTCAPGFCLLMGVGLVFFIDSRTTKHGWSLARTAKYIVIRGLLFVLVGYVSIIPFRQQFHVQAFVIVDIIFTLGIDFILAGMIVLLAQRFETGKNAHYLTAMIGVLSVTLACLTISLAQFRESPVVQLLWLSGGTPTSFFVSRFPPLSWLPLVLYGAFYARLMKVWPRHTAALSFLFSMIFFLLFLAVRIPGNWGNLTPVDADWYRKGVKEFFWTNKYCPDLAFITLFSAIDHLFITIFTLLPSNFPGLTIPGTGFVLNTNQVLLDIGTSPFAFYFIHFYSLLIIGLVLKSLGLVWSQRELGPGYTGAGIGNGWAFWLVYLLLVGWMWFVCRLYGRFKSQKPAESIWRFF